MCVYFIDPDSFRHFDIFAVNFNIEQSVLTGKLKSWFPSRNWRATNVAGGQFQVAWTTAARTSVRIIFDFKQLIFFVKVRITFTTVRLHHKRALTNAGHFRVTASRRRLAGHNVVGIVG